MGSHAFKFEARRALSSTANPGPRLAGRANAGRTLNSRFRDAVARVKAATGQSSSQIADELGVDPTRFNHWMKTDESRPVNLSAVQAVEVMAQGVRADYSDADIAQAVRELARAQEQMDRVLKGLKEGVA